MWGSISGEALPPSYTGWSPHCRRKISASAISPRALPTAFVSPSAAAQIEYKCTDFYDPADEIHVRWDDPTSTSGGLWMTLSYRRRIVRPLTCAMILSGYLPSNSAPNRKILLTGANGQPGRALQMALKHHHGGGACSDQIDIAQLDQVCLPRGAISWASLDDQCRGLQRC